jgi:hypothetical protein
MGLSWLWSELTKKSTVDQSQQLVNTLILCIFFCNDHVMNEISHLNGLGFVFDLTGSWNEFEIIFHEWMDFKHVWEQSEMDMTLIELIMSDAPMIIMKQRT